MSKKTKNDNLKDLFIIANWRDNVLRIADTAARAQNMAGTSGKIMRGPEDIPEDLLSAFWRLATGDMEKNLSSAASQPKQVWAKLVNGAKTRAKEEDKAIKTKFEADKAATAKKNPGTPQVPALEGMTPLGMAEKKEEKAPAKAKDVLAKAKKVQAKAKTEKKEEKAPAKPKAEKKKEQALAKSKIKKRPDISLSDPTTDPVSHGLPVLLRVAKLRKPNKPADSREFTAVVRMLYSQLDPSAVFTVRTGLEGKKFETNTELYEASAKAIQKLDKNDVLKDWSDDVVQGVGRLVFNQVTQRRGSGNWITYQLLQGIDIELIVDACATIFPSSNQGVKDVGWYEWDCRRWKVFNQENKLSAEGKKTAEGIFKALDWKKATQEMV